MGCLYRFHIVVQNNGKTLVPSFYFTKNSNKKIDIPLNYFAIYDYTDTIAYLSKPIWWFSLEAGHAKTSKEITYGTIPEGGFKEIKKASNLLLNKKYLVRASGSGCDGEIIFTIVDKNNEYKIISKNL